MEPLKCLPVMQHLNADKILPLSALVRYTRVLFFFFLATSSVKCLQKLNVICFHCFHSETSFLGWELFICFQIFQNDWRLCGRAFSPHGVKRKMSEGALMIGSYISLTLCVWSSLTCFAACGLKVKCLKSERSFPQLYLNVHRSIGISFLLCGPLEGCPLAFLKLHQRGNGGEKELLILRFVRLEHQGQKNM